MKCFAVLQPIGLGAYKVTSIVQQLTAPIHEPGMLAIEIHPSTQTLLRDFTYVGGKWVKDSSEKPKICVVSSWNIKCGISEYSKGLVRECLDDGETVVVARKEDPARLVEPDEPFVTRLDSMADLTKVCVDRKVGVVHVQHEHGLFIPDDRVHIDLVNALNSLSRRGVRIAVTLHACTGWVGDNLIRRLERCDVYFVHTKTMSEAAVRIGVPAHKVIQVPLPVVKCSPLLKDAARRKYGLDPDAVIIGSGGFLSTYKQFHLVTQLLVELERLLGKRVLHYCVTPLHGSGRGASLEYEAFLRETAKRIGRPDNLIIDHDYHSQQEVVERLSAADVLALPYKQINDASSSASVRLIMQTCRPVFTTFSCMMDGLAGSVVQIPQETWWDRFPSAVAEILQNETGRGKILAQAKALVDGNSWGSQRRFYRDFYRI